MALDMVVSHTCATRRRLTYVIEAGADVGGDVQAHIMCTQSGFLTDSFCTGATDWQTRWFWTF